MPIDPCVHRRTESQKALHNQSLSAGGTKRIGIVTFLNDHPCEFTESFTRELSHRLLGAQSTHLQEGVEVASSASGNVNLRVLEEEAWVRYIRDFKEEFKSRLDCPQYSGEIEGPRFQEFLVRFLKEKGVSREVFLSQVGGILDRYIGRWIKYITVVEWEKVDVQQGSPKKEFHIGVLRLIRMRVKERLELIVKFDFPKLSIYTNHVKDRIDTHIDRLKEELNLRAQSENSAPRDNDILSAFAFGNKLNQFTFEVVANLKTHTDEYFESLLQAKGCLQNSDSIIALRGLAHALRQKEKLDYYECVLGEGYLTLPEFYRGIQSVSEAHFVVRKERDWAVGKLEELKKFEGSLIDEDQIIEALNNWVVCLKGDSMSISREKAYVLADSSSLDDMEVMLNAKKEDHEAVREKLPRPLLYYQEFFYKAMNRARADLSNAFTQLETQPQWFQELDNKTLQLANALQKCAQKYLEDDQRLFYESFSIWADEIVKAHYQSGDRSLAQMPNWRETFNKTYIEEKLEHFVCETSTILIFTVTGEECISAIHRQLRNILMFYYTQWASIHVALEFNRAFSVAFERVIARVPASEDRKSGAISRVQETLKKHVMLQMHTQRRSMQIVQEWFE